MHEFAARAGVITGGPNATPVDVSGGPISLIGIGAGGHARCVIDAMRSLMGRFRIIGLYDDDPRLAGQSVVGVPVLGAFNVDRDNPSSSRATAAFVGVGGVGLTDVRRRLFHTLDTAGFALPAIIHRSALISPRAHVADAAQVLTGAILNSGATVSVNAIINAGVIVGHDASIGAHTHVASGAIIGGGAVIESGVHIGSGATVLEGRHVGKGAVVGSGTIVNRDVPPNVTVVGVPARIIADRRTVAPESRTLAAS